jgi:PKD repeat protein
MVRRIRWVVVALSLALLMAGGVVAMAAPAQAVATTNAAFWSMDEAPGSRTMTDSSGNRINGTVGADVETGVRYDGASAYRFPNISPTAPPARPEHVVQVPTNPRLNPDAGDYSVTVRYRTTKSYGNIVQKGQNATAGGYWKFEQPNGIVTCLFKGANGQQRSAWSRTPLNDGQWHTVRCERTSTSVTMYVDGVRHSRLAGSTGTIANTWELAIGGKTRCDQNRTTCDYFTGDIDYVRVEKGSAGPANQAPVASLGTDCTGLVCSLNGAGSTDADGAIQSYAWDFGDGSTANTGSVPTTSHAYAAPGTFSARLTVTDDRGATHTTAAEVTVQPAVEQISFVDRAAATANAVTHSLVVPATVQPGDGLLLFFSENTHATIGDPTGVPGWVRLDRIDGGFGTTQVWRKVAVAADAGSTLRITLSVQSKGNLMLAAYRGTDSMDPVASFARTADTSSTATRVTPYAQVSSPGAWAVSYWMHGDSASTALTPPSGVAVRASASLSGGGRVTALLADSGAGLPSGTYGGLAATAAAASTTGTTWTVVLAPGG